MSIELLVNPEGKKVEVPDYMVNRRLANGYKRVDGDKSGAETPAKPKPDTTPAKKVDGVKDDGKSLASRIPVNFKQATISDDKEAK